MHKQVQKKRLEQNNEAIHFNRLKTPVSYPGFGHLQYGNHQAYEDWTTLESIKQNETVPLSSSFSHNFSRIPVNANAPIQAKLSGNPTGDAYEQEADRVGKQVLQTVEPEHSCSCGGKCDKCRNKHAGHGLKQLQAKSIRAGYTSQGAPSVVQRATSSRGQSIDPATRNFMEARIGHDFSRVRIHADGEAATAAHSIGAKAYTIGNDIVFGKAEYDPNSMGGRSLLAHELTHVIQQQGGTQTVQRAPDPLTQQAPAPSPADEALEKAAVALETEILADPVFKKLAADSKARVRDIIAVAKTKPPGDGKGQRNYYLAKLKVAITTPFDGKETGKAEYGCSESAEKANRAAVEKALEIEKRWWDDPTFADVEEKAVASGTNKVERVGEQGKKFLVDRSDPRNIRVQIKVKLNGKADEVASIKKLEDAIERASHTKGYYLDIVFVNTAGPDVFEFTVNFCMWANSGNWASGPTTLSHEVHHALGLGDRYDYIESHSGNRQMNVPMRLVWFAEQMKKTTSNRDPFSKMSRNTNPLLSEDICAVAFQDKAEQKKCIDARKDLDPAGVPAL